MKITYVYPIDAIPRNNYIEFLGYQTNNFHKCSSESDLILQIQLKLLVCWHSKLDHFLRFLYFIEVGKK